MSAPKVRTIPRLIVGRDIYGHFVAQGLPWVVYCPCCAWGAAFTRWELAIGWADEHRRATRSPSSVGGAA